MKSVANLARTKAVHLFTKLITVHSGKESEQDSATCHPADYMESRCAKKEISLTPQKLLPAAAPETRRSTDLLTTQNTKSTRCYRTIWIKLDIYFNKRKKE